MKKLIFALGFLSTQTAFSFPVYFCKMKFFDNHLYESPVTADVCKAAWTIFDECRNTQLKGINTKNSEYFCRIAIKERMECVDLTKNGESVDADCTLALLKKR